MEENSLIWPIRSPWPDWFPPIYVHSPYGFYNHLGARYPRDPDVGLAKYAGESADEQDEAFEAAERVVARYIRKEALQGIAKNLCGKRTYVLSPVKPTYPLGNVLAYHFAGVIAQELDLLLGDGVFQFPRMKRDRTSNFWKRLANPVEFFCDPDRDISDVIESGADYIIADDVLTYGGTLCGLRSFIEHAGGRVICMTALVGMPEHFERSCLEGLSKRDQGRYVNSIFGYPPGEFPIAVSDSTLLGLRSYQDQIPLGFFEELLGYGIESFTEREASHLLQKLSQWGSRFSLERFREGIIRARCTGDAG